MPDIERAERWLSLLYPRLAARRSSMEKFNNYYDGNHPLPFLTKAHQDKVADEFRRLLEESRSNFMALVVDAVEERLEVEGFRQSARSGTGDDADAWAIWQANGLDVEMPQGFVDALVKGVCYLSVWEPDEGTDFPRIAVEDALETIVAYTPGYGHRYRSAALKAWKDEDAGIQRANVYLPDGVYKFKAPADAGTPQIRRSAAPQSGFIQNVYASAASKVKEVTNSEATWELVEGDEFVENATGIVPIVPLRNRPRIRCEGRSELDGPHLIQEQINGVTFLAAMAGYFGAHRQRWAVGIGLTKNEKGEAIAPFDAAIDRLWTSKDKDVKFGEFEQTDLQGYISLIEQKVLHLAVTTRTPRHYLIQQGQSPSGDAIEGAESGLVKKVGRRATWFGEGIEEAMQLGRAFLGGETAVDSEVIWGDAEVENEAANTDAAIKRFQAGLTPWEQTMIDLGYSQTEIARMRTQQAEDQLALALTQPTPPVPDVEIA